MCSTHQKKQAEKAAVAEIVTRITSTAVGRMIADLASEFGVIKKSHDVIEHILEKSHDLIEHILENSHDLIEHILELLGSL
jgi:hypothetical protein